MQQLPKNVIPLRHSAPQSRQSATNRKHLENQSRVVVTHNDFEGAMWRKKKGMVKVNGKFQYTK